LEQQAVPDGGLEVVLQQLACPKLRQLHLSGFILIPAAIQGLLQGCPLLQELSLTSCWLEVAGGSPINRRNALTPLTALSTLTRLHLGDEVSVAAPGGDLTEPNLAPLSALTGLQELSLEEPTQQQLQRLFRRSNAQQQQQNALLLPSLTKLSIVTDPGQVQYSSNATPGLYELSSLRCLHLRGAEVGSVQQLSALSQSESVLLHSATSLWGDDDATNSDSDGFNDNLNGKGHPSVTDTGELLQLLLQLTRLTLLDVFGLTDPAAVVPQWTCLGCCTGLQVLRLQNLFMHRDSWPLMFAGAQLTKLRALCLTIFYSVHDYRDDAYMPPEAVQQMVDACPNLEVLQIGGDALLSSCSENCMPYVRSFPPVSLAAVAQLQHLTSLRVYFLRPQVCFCGPPVKPLYVLEIQ
jgi:hypothetical protein